MIRLSKYTHSPQVTRTRVALAFDDSTWSTMTHAEFETKVKEENFLPERAMQGVLFVNSFGLLKVTQLCGMCMCMCAVYSVSMLTLTSLVPCARIAGHSVLA